MGLFSSLSKLGSNIVGGVGDLVNNPVKAVKDGLQDPATLAALAAAAGGYGLGASGGLGGLFGSAEAGAVGTAAGLGDLGAASAFEAGLPVAADAAAAISPGAFGASGIPWAAGVDAGGSGASSFLPSWMPQSITPQGLYAASQLVGPASKLIGGLSGSGTAQSTQGQIPGISNNPIYHPWAQTLPQQQAQPTAQPQAANPWAQQAYKPAPQMANSGLQRFMTPEMLANLGK